MDNNYISGFVDGEGTFHICFQRRSDLKYNWQVVPEFHINQNGTSKNVLEKIRNILDCGYIKRNDGKSEKDKTLVYVVRRKKDLLEKVIPFFEKYPLWTEKRNDFLKFKEVLKMMDKDQHLVDKGFRKIVDIAFSMNAEGIYRRIKKEQILSTYGSSETIRQAT